MQIERPFLTVNELATLLGVSTRTVYNLCWQNKIPYIKVGTHVRIHRDVVSTLVRGGTAGLAKPASPSSANTSSDAQQ